MKDIDDLWQADLIDMQALAKKNCNHKYILAVIDTFSKYAWVVPLKRKTKNDVFNAFQSIIFKDGRVPKNLQTDLGTEFFNDKFKELTSTNNINHYSTYSTKKASIAERFIRTIKSKMYKEFSIKGNYKWIDGTLHHLINKYNNTYHRTIGTKPVKVNDDNKQDIMKRYMKINQSYNNKNKKIYKVNDFVRISKYKGTFEKGYTPNWSTEIFKIVKRNNTSPITYLLQDMRNQPILGAFYAQELQKTKHPNIYLVEKVLKRTKDKVFVKWLGLPPSENSWIDKSNAL